MSPTNPQIDFLKSIENFLPNNISLVVELSETLGISNDSAYRRIRGETTLSFDEVILLCRKFKISFDEFIGNPSQNLVSFSYQAFTENVDFFKAYFINLNQEISMIRHSKVENKHVLFAGQGIPIFHYLKFPKLTAFKMFYWMKSIMNVEHLQQHAFSQELIPEELVEVGNQIFEHYLHLPSTEIWTDTTVLGTLHQIQFYWDSGSFSSREDALQICEDVRSLLAYVQQAAASTKKQDDYDQPTQYGAALNLYFSEIEFENNCILVDFGEQRKVYLGQLSFGTLVTENDQYYQVTQGWLQNILRKSNLISGISDTMRYQFFRRCNKHLDRLIDRIQND
jgi:hypothetical protein